MQRHKCPHCGGDVLIAVAVMHPREMADHSPVWPRGYETKPVSTAGSIANGHHWTYTAGGHAVADDQGDQGDQGDEQPPRMVGTEYLTAANTADYLGNYAERDRLLDEYERRHGMPGDTQPGG